jgi:hypothetical protein
MSFQITVPRGVQKEITVTAFGGFDMDGDGVNESTGEGVHSPSVFYTAPSVHLAGFVGCYTDLVSGVRALPTLLMSTGATSATCLAAAKTRKFAYTGLQFSRECWGGDDLKFAPVADTECRQACTANPGELCGASSRNSIYRTGLPGRPKGVRLLR